MSNFAGVVNCLTNLLPPTSFVGFSTMRLAHPQLEWVNDKTSYGRSFDLETNSFCIPLSNEEKGAYLEETKQYYGERYGGSLIGNNGGGVRCGLSGGVQIKGIGKNPLAGTPEDFWHTHGAASWSYLE